MKCWSIMVYKFFCFFFLLSIISYAQSSIGNSPLSIYGIGLQTPLKASRSEGLGGLGVAFKSTDNINISNPALLYFNRATNFETLSSVRLRNVSSGEANDDIRTGGVDGLFFSFPILKRASLAIVSKRFSNVEYGFEQRDTVVSGGDSNSVLSRYSGSGSSNLAVISFGYKINQYLYAGASFNYIYGNLDYTNGVVINQAPGRGQSFESELETVMSPSGIFPEFGLYAEIPLKTTITISDLETDTTISGSFNWGVTYRPEVDMAARYSENQNLNLVRVGFGSPSTISEIPINNGWGSMTLPNRVQIGGTYAITNNKYSLNIGIEIDFEQSSQLRREDRNEELNDWWHYGFGMEFNPLGLGKGTSFFNRLSYRFGTYYEQLPYVVQNNAMTEIGTNFGVGIPIVSKGNYAWTRPVINLSVQNGLITTANNTIYNESFTRFNIGIILNDNGWFRRRVFD